MGGSYSSIQNSQVGTLEFLNTSSSGPSHNYWVITKGCSVTHGDHKESSI